MQAIGRLAPIKTLRRADRLKTGFLMKGCESIITALLSAVSDRSEYNS